MIDSYLAEGNNRDQAGHLIAWLADRIAVLSAGRLVEVGTHATLLERSSLYASLYRFQFARQQDETLAAKAR